jgi:integral membrane protein
MKKAVYWGTTSPHVGGLLAVRPSPAGDGAYHRELTVTLLKTLTAVAFAEAISWMALLVAMVFKYAFDRPDGVSIVGPIHGFLFLAFVGLLVVTHVERRWPVRKSLLALAESIPPFTGFLLGSQLLSEVRQQPGGSSTLGNG